MPPDASSLDPTIPLKAGVGGGGASITYDPLGSMNKLSEIQNRINQNLLFQQQFQSNKAWGPIFAQSVDQDTGEIDYNKALRLGAMDPRTAFTLPTVANTIAQRELTIAQRNKEALAASTAAVKGFQENVIVPSLNDPKTFANNMAGYIKTVPASSRPLVQQYADSVVKTLTDGNPTPEQLNHRMLGFAGAAGMKLDDIAVATGRKPMMLDTGNVKRPGSEDIISGAFTPAGNALGIGAPAGVTQGPSGPMPHGAIGPGGGSESGAAAPLNNALGVAPPATAQPIQTASTAYDGKPLIASDTKMVSPSVRPGGGIGGLNILSKAQQAQADELQNEFNTVGLKQFQTAQTMLGSLQYVDNAIDTLAKGGGFLTPGAAGHFRADVAKFFNTGYQIIGKEPPFDVNKVATAEELFKETKRMGLQVTNQFLGGQREAAQVISGITSSVPGIDNTVLGAKLVTESLRALGKRTEDERNFLQSWSTKNQGNMAGAAEEFNKQHPAEDYASKVLSDSGMTATGFASPQAIMKAYKQGFLTKKQAIGIASKQFPEGPPQ